ncbi:hypothetical protein PR003_g21483 [Phytophthora rubi]|uniref:Uncharacterized protein n=1 Tax=Phytophthora rubi TaxID=129364 RepID=A0A6A4DPE8_9STRA|nr:hypothetical protein PR001_g15959 [Phytophthora rubi]KAE9305475.1 hypothetical protein PR003_g21483 [Phytophthora rubi]
MASPFAFLLWDSWRSILIISASSTIAGSNFFDADNAFGVKGSMLSPSALNGILVARSNVDTMHENYSKPYRLKKIHVFHS